MVCLVNKRGGNLMKKIVVSIISFVLTKVVVDFIGMQLIKLFVLNDFDFKYIFDYSLLFLDGNKFFLLLSFFAFLVWFEIIYGIFFRDDVKKRRLTKNEQLKYAKIDRTRDVKKSLLRVDFNKTGLVEHRMSKQALKIKMTPIIDKINKRTKDIPILNNTQKVLIPAKCWNIGDKKCYVRAGFPITGNRKCIYVDPGDVHNLVIGTTGSGKTWTFVNEYLELCAMCGESVVVNDPKGELAKHTLQKFKDNGFNTVVINFVDPEFSNCWNPFKLAFDEWKKADEIYIKKYEEWKIKNKNGILEYELLGLDTKEIENKLRKPKPNYSKAMDLLRDACNTICLEENPKDPIWTETARDMLVGCGALMCEEGKVEYMNAISFKKIIEIGKKQLPGIRNSKTILKAFLDSERSITDYSVNYLEGYVGSSGDTSTGFESQFNNKLSILTANEDIQRITSHSDFDFRQIGSEKTAIFLIVHDEKKTYYPLVTLFIKQLYEVLVRTARDEINLRLKVPINLILDEFGNMPALPDVDAMLTAARSRGIRLTAIIQGLEQLEKHYGKIAETLKGNFTNTIYLLSGSDSTVEEISKKAGSERVWNKDMRKYEDQRIFTPERLKDFKMGEILFLRQRHKNPYYTRLLPYDKYVFFDKSKFYLNLPIVEKPDVELFNIEYEYLKRHGKADKFDRFARN